MYGLLLVHLDKSEIKIVNLSEFVADLTGVMHESDDA